MSVTDGTGARLRQAMEEGGVTTRALADATGLSTSTIYLLRQGKELPGGRTCLLLWQACGLSVDWLLCGEGEMWRADDGCGADVSAGGVHDRLVDAIIGSRLMPADMGLSVDAYACLLRSGGRYPGATTLLALHEAAPTVSLTWVVTGCGSPSR